MGKIEHTCHELSAEFCELSIVEPSDCGDQRINGGIVLN